MAIFEIDDIEAHLLEPEESLDFERTGIDPDEGYPPSECPSELRAWGFTAREARVGEGLARRSARRLRIDPTDPG